MSTLILVLPATSASNSSEYAYVLTGDGQSIEKQGTATASALPAAGRISQTIAVVPCTQLSWHSIHLPPGLTKGARNQSSRLRAALDGLLEERLLDDPAALHLALEPQAMAGTSCWVAACNKAWLHGHIQALEAARHTVGRIAPEISPQPTPRLWAVGEADNPWLLATGLDSSASICTLPLRGDKTALTALLQSVPADVAIEAEPQTVQAIEGLGRPVALTTAAQRALAASQSNWDLAQFELDQGSQSRMRRRFSGGWQSFWQAPQWRAARWAAMLAVVAQLIGLNIWAWQENRAIAQKQQMVNTLLLQSFPKIPVVVDAPVQMQRELALLRSNSGALSRDDLEPLLAASTQLEALVNTSHLQAVEYQDRQLRLKGLKLEAEALADVQERLAATGYRLQRDGGDLLLSAQLAP